MSLKTFDFKQVAMIFGGRILQGFADGEVITLEPQGDAFSEFVGADGEVTRSKSNNPMWTATIRLSQTSDSNDILMGFFLADQKSNGGVVPFLMKDNNGRTLVSSEQAYIKRAPNLTMGVETGVREWQIVLPSPDIFVEELRDFESFLSE